MAEPGDMEELAAEFALGSLPPAERQEAEALMASDPAFAAMVKAWERRLIPLALALEPVEAPPRIRGAVMKAIAGDAAGSEMVVAWKHKASAWRLATLGASAIAASLAAFIALDTPEGPLTDQRMPVRWPIADDSFRLPQRSLSRICAHWLCCPRPDVDALDSDHGPESEVVFVGDKGAARSGRKPAFLLVQGLAARALRSCCA